MDDKRDEFFERLDELSKGERAVLKRAAGTMLDKSDGRAIAAFFRCYPQKPEEQYFAAACIYCMWDWDMENTQARKLQDILCELRRDETLSESMQHRLVGLLDTKWADDGYLLTKLVRIVKMVKAKGYAVDCAELLRDLNGWNSDTQYVQRKWARAFYQIKQSDKTEQ